MLSVRRLAIVLALAFTFGYPVFGQGSSNSSGAPETPSAKASAQNQNQAQNQAQSQAQPASSQQSQSVQERIRLRREQRRAQAIHDAYSQRYESWAGMGYLRFVPGPGVQRTTYYAWDLGGTRYKTERLGYTLDARGYNGIAYVGLNPASITRPKISTYAVMAGPTYRFYLQPRFSISGRVMGGWALGNFSGDTNGIGGQNIGGGVGLNLYPDANTYAADATIIGEINVSPSVALHLAPEYFFTGFGSTTQYSRGFSGGVVYRFGKR
jgi:hypothetical protein